MATKLNPGPHDCYARALADEPLFTLLARDPIAPFLVSIWSSLRMADEEAARANFEKLLRDLIPQYWSDPDVEKAGEAIDCALAMFKWRAENDGRWRAPVTAPACTGLAGNGRLLCVDSEGWAQLERDGLPQPYVRLYRGARMAYLGPDPRDPSVAVMAVEGGAADADDHVVDGVAFTISASGLRALATELAQDANSLDATHSIAPRKVL